VMSKRLSENAEFEIRWNRYSTLSHRAVEAVDLQTGKVYKPPSYALPEYKQREAILEQICEDRKARGCDN
jgi:hypothetical protein